MILIPKRIYPLERSFYEFLDLRLDGLMAMIKRAKKPAGSLPGEDLEFVENYGELVREARIRTGLTQEELASQVGEKATVIKKIEHGELRPSIELARKLEKILRIRLLVPAEEEPSSEIRKYLVKPGASGGVSLGDLLKKRKKEEP
jgi:putative transcription factor